MRVYRGISRRSFLGAALVSGVSGLTAGAAAAPRSAKDAWRIGIYTRPWGKHDYRVALDAIAEAGFKHVGLMTTKAKSNLVISVNTTQDEALAVGEECKKRGLTIPSAYCGGIPVKESLEAGIAGMRTLVDCCTAAGVENLMMGGIGDETLYEPYYKAISECCAYAEEKGVGVSVKPHGGLNATGPQCRKTVDFVGHKNFGIWYDPGNIFYYSDAKLNPIDDAATVDGLVVGMCIKDYIHPKNVMVTPGEGQVDFPKVMARLKQGGFTGGALVIECLAPGDLDHLLAEAKKARRFVEELVA